MDRNLVRIDQVFQEGEFENMKPEDFAWKVGHNNT